MSFSSLNKIATSLSWNMLNQIVELLLKTAQLMILARLLTPSELGVATILVLSLVMVERLSTAGVNTWVLKYHQSSRDACIFYTHVLIISVSLSALLFFLKPSLSLIFEEYSWDFIDISPLFLIIAAFSTVQKSELQRRLEFKKLSIIEMFSAIAQFLVTVILAYNDFSFNSLLYGWMARVSSLFILMACYSQPKITLKEYTKFIISKYRIFTFLVLNDTLNWIANRGDNFIVAAFFNPLKLGLYSRSYQLMDVINALIGHSLFKFLFPFLVDRKNKNESLSIELLMILNAFCFLVGLSISIYFYWFSKELILVIFGDQWLDMQPLFSLLCVGVIPRILYKLYGSYVFAFSNPKTIFKYQFIYAAVLILSIIFAANHSIEFVAFAVVFSLFLNTFFLGEKVLQMVECKFNFVVISFLPGFFCSVLFVLLLGGCEDFMLKMDIIERLIFGFLLWFCTTIIPCAYWLIRKKFDNDSYTKIDS